MIKASWCCSLNFSWRATPTSFACFYTWVKTMLQYPMYTANFKTLVTWPGEDFQLPKLRVGILAWCWVPEDWLWLLHAIQPEHNYANMITLNQASIIHAKIMVYTERLQKLCIFISVVENILRKMKNIKISRSAKNFLGYLIKAKLNSSCPWHFLIIKFWSQ